MTQKPFIRFLRACRPVILVVFAFVSVSVAVPFQNSQGVDSAPNSTERVQVHPLSKVVFIGASVSAGFGNARELEVGRSVKLGTFFEQVLRADGGPTEVYDFGSSQFFMDPLGQGITQVKQALGKNPTLIIGIDYLFWYAFGYPRKNNPRRLEGLRMGLERLEGVDCHLIVGDLPNVDHALNGKSALRGGHPILRQGQIASEEERLAMNELIHAWAVKRPNVHVFPLAGLMKKMVAGDEMELRGNTWRVKSLDQILQPDLLHPKVRGAVWVAMNVAQSTLQLPGVKSEDFGWDETKIKARLWVSLEPARVKQAKLEARRKARRAKLDKKKSEAGVGAGR